MITVLLTLKDKCKKKPQKLVITLLIVTIKYTFHNQTIKILKWTRLQLLIPQTTVAAKMITKDNLLFKAKVAGFKFKNKVKISRESRIKLKL